MIKIYDENEPKPTLDEILNMKYSTRIDRIIGHDIPPEVSEYLKDATEHNDKNRRERMSDQKMLNSLEVLIKSIDTSAFNPAEEKRHSKILDKVIKKYRF